MQTALRPVAADGHGSEAIYREAVAILRAGGLVAFPSETVYGLGGDALNPAAVAAIFTAKNRPADNPLIVHVRDQEHALELVTDPFDRLSKLAAAFWPGPLTVVLPRAAHVDKALSRGLPTLALRVPNHGVALRLIRASGLALAAPSANVSGRPSPTTGAHVLADLAGRIPLILDGGPCEVGIESTVVDISSEVVRVLRPGHIQAQAIAQVLGEQVAAAGTATLHRSPGTRYRHYRPQAAVWLVDDAVSPHEWASIQKQLNQAPWRWGYAGQRTIQDAEKTSQVHLPRDSDRFARHLYAVLRDFDDQGVALILVDAPARSAANTAVWDRLEKAADVLLKDSSEVSGLLAKIPSKSSE